jgi:putative transcriptional regulator
MIDLSRLNYRLISLRAERGLSQYAVAKATKLGKATVCSHENGKRIPSLLAVCTYADYYGLTVSELLGEENGKKETD